MLSRLSLVALVTLTTSCAEVGPGPDADPDPTLPELGPLPDELGDLRWPAPPGITTEVDVHSLAELLDATSRPGTRARVRADIPEHVVVTASDVEVVVDEGVTMGTLLVDRGLSRVTIRGGRWRGLEVQVPASFLSGAPEYRDEWMSEDVLFDGVEVEAPASAFNLRGRRVAVVRSAVLAEHYSVWTGGTGPLDSEDIILAENVFASAGPEATVRLVDVLRSATIDNVLSNGMKHNYRVHGRSDLALATRNVMITTGIMLGTQPEDEVGRVFVDDNVLHHTAPSLLLVDPALERLESRRNVVYTDIVGCWLCQPPAAGWTVEDNALLPYQPPP